MRWSAKTDVHRTNITAWPRLRHRGLVEVGDLVTNGSQWKGQRKNCVLCRAIRSPKPRQRSILTGLIRANLSPTECPCRENYYFFLSDRSDVAHSEYRVSAAENCRPIALRSSLTADRFIAIGYSSLSTKLVAT